MTIRLALATALAACLLGIAGYAYGVSVGADREQAATKRAEAARAAQRAELQRQIDAATQRAQVAELTRQTSVREIRHESEKIIERPVYSAVCIDADGVRLLDRAAATANIDDRAASAGSTGAPANGPAD
jgi:GAF domain-containing protein